MLSVLCTIFLLVVFFKILGLAIKLSFGILKILLYLVFFPGIVLALIFSGVFVVAIPLLIIAGLLSLVVKA
jgi:hypothetical protein